MNEVLFWTHVLIILAALSVGLFLPLPVVIFLVAMHKLHLLIFDGCLFSRLQQKFGAMPCDKDFFQFLSKKLFNIELSAYQSKTVHYLLLLLTVTLAAVRYL